MRKGLHRETNLCPRAGPQLLLPLLLFLRATAALVAIPANPDQPDDAGGSHPCARPCQVGQPMTCRYEFNVENYHSMSKACYDCPWNVTDCARPHCIVADGVPRALVVVNRQLPGPSLQVCQGDRIEVTLHNHMPEQSTSVHWHGMHQRGTPYMDGVPYVTQCPIPPHSSFRYFFHANNAGTHFWHSHTGCQRADGAVGFLTVRVPRPLDPHASLYDEDRPEHGLLVLDWTHQLAASKFLAHHHAGDDNKADSVLINGKGVYRRFTSGSGDERQFAFTPRETYNVQKGQRYRFRLVNAGFLNCPLELSVDNHTLLVIASDGVDIQPVRVDSLVSYAGERWDVVLEADQAVANYWVRLHGLLDCGPRRAHEAAILHYHGADPNQDPAGPLPAYDAPRRSGLQLNSLNRGSADPDTLTAAELRGLPQTTPDPALQADADVQLFVSYDFYALDNPLIHRKGLYGISQVTNSPNRVFTPQLNHVSLSLPPFPLLSGRDRLEELSRVSPGSLCNESSLAAQGRDCRHDFCECTHVINVPLGGVLEIVLVDQGERYDANHPFHLHGHSFRVVGLEKLGTKTSVEEVQRLDAKGLLTRNLIDPPIKDTVTVPDGGYTVLRVHANNPGYWLFHCHIEFHVELGMALVIKVGEHEDMAPVPRGFPQCGDWSSNDWLGDETEHLEPSNDLQSGRAFAKLSLPKHNDTASTSTTVESTPRSTTTMSIDAIQSNNTSPDDVTVDATTDASITEYTTALPNTVTSAESTDDDMVDEVMPSSTESPVDDATLGTTVINVDSNDQGMDDVFHQLTGSKHMYKYDVVHSTAVSTDKQDATGPTDSTREAADKPIKGSDKDSDRIEEVSRKAPAIRPLASALSEFIMRVNPQRDGEYRASWVIEDPDRPELRYNVLVAPAHWSAGSSSRAVVGLVVPLVLLALCLL